MSIRRTSIASLAGATSHLAGWIGLILLAGCGKSCVDTILERDCSNGEKCMEQAQALVRRNIKDKSEERATKAVILFQKACDLGADRSCSTLGVWLEEGGLAAIDLPRAVRLYERGCGLKDVTACHRLAYLYRVGRGVPKDPALESKYRDLTCDLADSMTASTFCSDERLAKEACVKPDSEACQFYRQRIVDEARRETLRKAPRPLEGSGEGIRLEDLGTIGRPEGPAPVRRHSKR